MADAPSKVDEAVVLARRTDRLVRQNIPVLSQYKGAVLSCYSSAFSLLGRRAGRYRRDARGFLKRHARVRHERQEIKKAMPQKTVIY